MTIYTLSDSVEVFTLFEEVFTLSFFKNVGKYANLYGKIGVYFSHFTIDVVRRSKNFETRRTIQNHIFNRYIP